MRCQPHGSELKLQAAGRIRHPESFVTCTPMPPRLKVVTDPMVVVEVLSDGTVNDDFVVNSAEYRATPRIQRDVVLQQTHSDATVFARKGEDWMTELASGREAVFRMPEIGIQLAVRWRWPQSISAPLLLPM